jgi:hypothetical protein
MAGGVDTFRERTGTATSTSICLKVLSCASHRFNYTQNTTLQTESDRRTSLGKNVEKKDGNLPQGSSVQYQRKTRTRPYLSITEVVCRLPHHDINSLNLFNSTQPNVPQIVRRTTLCGIAPVSPLRPDMGMNLLVGDWSERYGSLGII